MSARINAFLKLAREQGASDIHLSVGMPPQIRLHGELTTIKYRELSKSELEELLKEILSLEELNQFNSGEDLDISYENAVKDLL